MGDDASSEPGPDQLQFETAEAPEGTPRAAGLQCRTCGNDVGDTYYGVGGATVCAPCREVILARQQGSATTRELLRAFAWGAGASLLGGLLWFAVRKITGWEIGLVAVAVGVLVGKAVSKGSGGRGGAKLQAMAIVLTYVGITANYLPDVLSGMWQTAQADRARGEAATSTSASASASPSDSTTITVAKDSPPPSFVSAVSSLGLVLLVALGISLAAPFLAGASNIIGLLLIGFALYEAWKLNRRLVISLQGPYHVTSPGLAIPSADLDT